MIELRLITKCYQKDQDGLMINNLDIINVLQKPIITCFNSVTFSIVTYICKVK